MPHVCWSLLQEYPIQKKDHSVDFLRSIPHLRMRTSFVQATMAARSLIQASLTSFYTSKKFHYIHPPIMTSSDCEGGSRVFLVKAKGQKEEFYGKQTFLTVSTQLHLEAAAIGSLSRVFTLCPAFRAEPSSTARHLSEFWMLEAECCFVSSLDPLMGLIVESIKESARVLVKEGALVKALNISENKSDDVFSHLESIILGRFFSVSYSDASDILENNNGHVSPSSSLCWSGWGQKMSTDHEQFLLKHHRENVDSSIVGIFITDYPSEQRPFYMRRGDSSRGPTVSNFDLIVERVGELAGGSLREERVDLLTDSIKKHSLTHMLEWYIDTRRFGTAPHGGYGIGFDRLVQWLTLRRNIREATFVPRTCGNILL